MSSPLSIPVTPAGIDRRRFIQGLAAASVLAPGLSHAAYPDRPVRLIIPFIAGGPTDQLARLFGDRLSKVLGQPVIADNRPGANSTVAVQATLQNGADGYTVFFAGQGVLAVTPQLTKKLPYDVDKDLTPVGVVANMPLTMVVNSSLPVKTVADFVAYAKARPGQLNFGSPGIGNPLHLAVELFNAAAGIRMQHIPFNGTAPALTALRSGEIHTVFDVVTTAVPHVKAGTLRALAVTSLQRSSALPEIPTMSESGYPGFEASSWYALTTASAAPSDVKDRLAKATQAVISDPEFGPTLDKLGLIPYPPMDMAAVQNFVQKERARWGTVIRENKITLDT
ncbi:Bug family tripartite tricarboxylate transporter substrate binding protein [Variovorax sp. VNK109]|jgi:tripartite-type tricarboxylate transporter receptor subunit TctC|uniref:Bug family tripartite tricarboxylate transporter substrate binding protein n=1 Tax=Variovorax sp. VNK109 TaxID=3400919 RepID=UPI003C0AE1F8